MGYNVTTDDTDLHRNCSSVLIGEICGSRKDNSSASD
jgi:hypothetical protein